MDTCYLDQDFLLIEQDPEGFCEQFEVDTLTEYIDRANDIYYNGSDPDCLRLSDYAYDWLVYSTNKKRKEASKEQSRIGAPPNVKNCVKLPHFMPSLDKVKIGKDLESFLSNNQIIWSLKLDGISAMITYNKGVPVKCYTRGNGTYGSDISYILEHINLPRNIKYQDITVRGELITSKKYWSETFGKSTDATARNWVSGLINCSFVSPYLKHVDFMPYEIISIGGETSLPLPLESFGILSDCGFNVVQYGELLPKVSSGVLIVYKNAMESYPYIIDGIVLSNNLPKSPDIKLKNPTNCVAFKINVKDQMRETTITGVDWSISRHGRLVPVAMFQPVFIDGAKVKRASVFNANTCVKKYGLCVGTKIIVTRSGGVIPIIVKIISHPQSTSGPMSPTGPSTAPSSPTAPSTVNEPCLPPTTYPWHWSGCDIVLDNPESCPDVIIQRHVHFFETLSIAGIREGMLKRFMEGGLTTINSIITASKERLRQINGVGPKRSESYYTDIRNGLANAQLYRIMMSSGCFPSGIGKSILRQIVASSPNIVESCQYGELIKLSGIGKVRATKIMEGMVLFKQFIKDFPVNFNHIHDITQKQINQKIIGKTFVLTNIDDDTLEDYIVDNGGCVGHKVEKDTHCVISGNILLNSEKQMDAYKCGVVVYNISEFENTYDTK